MIRLAIAVLLAVLIATPAAWAEAPKAEDAKRSEVAAGAPADVSAPPPAPKRQRRRLTTAERWRGKPYLSNEDAALRGQALNRGLPVVDSGYKEGLDGGFGFRLQAAEDTALRREALDRSVPTRWNFNGAGGF